MKRPYMSVCIFSVGLVHYSWDSQVQILANFSLKLGLTVLFTYLKIILLQCFQFSVINGIQTDPIIYLTFVCLHC